MGRPSASASGLYGSRWRKQRQIYLTLYPLCKYCQEDGRTTPATELDHIKQHHGDPALFWDTDNWQGLCSQHHRSTKARLERSGRASGCDRHGNPIHTPKHWV